jgi:dihydroorotate dehydrogenase electron transfer subunit
MPEDLHIFNLVSRTHSYWGRKPVSGILDAFRDVKEGDIVVDPFCGGGTPVLAALFKKARVIASDLNPMATFLTRVIARPLNITSLIASFNFVKNEVSKEIEDRYATNCPKCGTKATTLYFVWEQSTNIDVPVMAKIRCNNCRNFLNVNLSTKQRNMVLKGELVVPKRWYPKVPIKTLRKTKFNFYYELFTMRNLTSLSSLLYAIKKVKPLACQEALLYVFSGALYSCSKMQMYSKKHPDSSYGWTALRFYVPPKRMEKNVWRTFETRFKSFLYCKQKLNELLPNVRVASTYNEFIENKCELLVQQKDFWSLSYSTFNRATKVYLDPPYSIDLDYLGFSEFWGSWFGMHFNKEKQLIPTRCIESYINVIALILKFIRKETHIDTTVTLAFGLKVPNAFDEIRNAIKVARYRVINKFPIIYTSDRGIASKKTDVYFNLIPFEGHDTDIIPIEVSESNLESNNKPKFESVYFYLGVVTHINTQKYPINSHQINHDPAKRGNIQSLTPKLLPEHLLSELGELLGKWNQKVDEEKEEKTKYEIDILEHQKRFLKILGDKVHNKQNYFELTTKLLEIILKHDGYTLSQLNKSLLSQETITRSQLHSLSDINTLEGCAFVAEKESRKIIFFFQETGESELRKIASEILRLDNNKFNLIVVMIVADTNEMNSLRSSNKAADWERGFFVCFDDIREKAFKVNSIEAMKLCRSAPIQEQKVIENDQIDTHIATVIDNKPVGRGNPPNHYKLKFTLTALQNILPGQFAMLGTSALPRTKQNPKPLTLKDQKLVGRDNISDLGSVPKAYLKRPFGIHRAFYKNFLNGYLNNLLLPSELSTILHTVYPNRFDVLYKVLDHGIGTKEMTELKPGDRIEVLGPLGRKFNPRFLDKSKYDEVHVIGGGVGIAPLIFLVQTLKLFGFKVRAFLGIESGDMLYEDPYSEKPENYLIYVNDLKDIGLTEDDIYVSFNSSNEKDPKIKHLKYGFISEHYSEYLCKIEKSQSMLAFTCGPHQMMKAIYKITQKFNIETKVLLEKRMACGIGVCFSCTCEKFDKNGDLYNSRVCLDGPLYNAEEIVW